MSLKIAVATTDGKIVNQHFGRSNAFLIFKLTSEQYTLEEIRKVVPLCQKEGHDEEEISNRYKIFHDCQVILVSRVGLSVKKELEAYGITIYEIKDTIDRALKKLQTSRLYQKQMV